MNWEKIKYLNIKSLFQYMYETGDSIECCTARCSYTHVDFVKGTSKEVSCNIKKIEVMLHSIEYYRSNKSNLVRIADIIEVDYIEGRIYLKKEITAYLSPGKATVMKFIMANRDNGFYNYFRKF